MNIKELIETLEKYKGKDVVVETNQPNPFQVVITINI